MSGRAEALTRAGSRSPNSGATISARQAFLAAVTKVIGRAAALRYPQDTNRGHKASTRAARRI